MNTQEGINVARNTEKYEVHTYKVMQRKGRSRPRPKGETPPLHMAIFGQWRNVELDGEVEKNSNH